MRVPSATGLVFGALAISGSALAAPTPSSPNPSSPNPNAIDSPRMADSPTMNSPLLSGRWLSASPALRMGSDRRRSIPRNARRDDKSDEKKPKAGEVHAQGLGILPQPVKDAVGGLLSTVDGVVAGLPVVGGLLGHTVGDTGKSLLDALDVKDKDKDKKEKDKKKPTAPPMTRSVDSRDEHVTDGHAMEDIPFVGDPTKGVVNTVNGILESKSRTFPRRQLAPPAMQLPVPVEAATGVAGGATSTAPSTLDSVPIVGSLLKEVVQTAMNTLDSVAPRALPVSPPVFVDQALPVAPPSTPNPSTILEDPTQSPGQIVGQAVAKLPDPVAGVVGVVAKTALGKAPTSGDKSPQDLAAGMVTSVPVSLPIPGSALRAIGVPLGVVSGAIDTGMDTADGLSRQAQGTMSTVDGTAPEPPSLLAAPASRRALTDIPNGALSSDIFGTATGIISDSPAGGTVQAVTGAASNSPAGGLKDTVTGMAANLPVAGVFNTAAGAASGLPVASGLSTVTETTTSSPAAGVMGAAKGGVNSAAGTASGVAGGAPAVGGVLAGVLSGGSDVGAKDVDDHRHHPHQSMTMSSSSAAPSATMSM
ncbi:hypothetical protein FRB97_002148 [Tulasnella sp. 331]|nr:hypothetical protein FRB97_002148 [Tulasnella sp. 331]